MEKKSTINLATNQKTHMKDLVNFQGAEKVNTSEEL